MSRSTAALLIAIMFHILLFILFYFLLHLKPKALTDKPEEHRLKVSLKEKPKTSKKSAAVENKQKPIEKAPPIPKGKQMEKLPQKKTASSKPVKKVASPTKSTKKSKPVEKPTVNKKVAYVKSVPKKTNEDVNITKEPIKKSGLYAKLSKKQKSKEEPKKTTQTGTQIGSDFKEAYGEAFGQLSAGEQKYIIDNQERMRRITQEQLNRLAPVNIPRNLHVNTMNIIEFYLHPNGDISGLKIISPSGQQILDDTSLQTVEYSYHRYPLPEQKTLVRYKVGYYLGGRRY